VPRKVPAKSKKIELVIVRYWCNRTNARAVADENCTTRVDVVGRFRAEGFVTSRENPVDITYECILREWPRLREWLERENRNARRLREVAEAAKGASWRPGLTPEQQKPVRE
jgi:hypothetical protein